MLVELGPFTGGLNLRDSYDEILANELADGTNFTLDERGVAIKRNDCPTTAALAGASTPPGAVIAFYYSQIVNLFFCQFGTGIYKAAPGAGSWTLIGTQTTSAAVSFTEFGLVMVYTHPVDGTYYYDGATLTQASNVVKGQAIATWQNKVWVAMGLRVYWTAPGAVSFTTATDFVDIREKDNKPLTALFPSSGLLAFREDSTHRINDSTTGAFQTIDWNTGCVGSLAVCGSDEGIFVWGLDGLYHGNGLGPFTLVGDKLRPRFTSATINSTTKPLIAGVYLNGRVYFAFPRTSSTIPDAILEYNPRVGWLMEAYLTSRVGPFAHYLNSSGVPSVSFASAAAVIKDLYTSTTRTSFSCSLSTGYVQPFRGKAARLRQLTAELDPGAAGSLALTTNYQDEGGVAQTLAITKAFANGGQQRPPLWPGRVGRTFQVKISDSAAALNALSVYGLGLEFLQVER